MKALKDILYNDDAVTAKLYLAAESVLRKMNGVDIVCMGIEGRKFWVNIKINNIGRDTVTLIRNYVEGTILNEKTFT